MVAKETTQTQMGTREPSFDILWSVVSVLYVIIIGLIIEVIISNRKKKVSNES
ncbi:MAG: hypothetical protein OEL69_01325 [Nitrosopumilus sp.]|nr:hypothetical protein [Nitrosopumilus sp.]